MNNSRPTRNSGLLIKHAVIWAVVILGLSYIFRDEAFGKNLSAILGGLFIISSSFLILAGRK